MQATHHTRPISEDPTAIESVRVIIFGIHNYVFALPMASVLKVTHCPSFSEDSLSNVGLVHIEDRTIRLLNLHQKFARNRQQSTAKKVRKTPQERGEFLILTQTRHGELCGIPVDELPEMIELPLSTIQVLPDAYRQSNLFGIASYVAVLPSEDKKLAIFLLDLEAALSLITINSPKSMKAYSSKLLNYREEDLNF